MPVIIMRLMEESKTLQRIANCFDRKGLFIQCDHRKTPKPSCRQWHKQAFTLFSDNDPFMAEQGYGNIFDAIKTED